MKRERKKVCLIASAGGHLEQIRQLKDVIERYDTYYVVPRVKSTEKMKQKKYLVDDMVRTNKIVLILHFIKMCFQQLYIFVKERPDVILTTGAGVAIPTCLIAKICRKKIIYIESFAVDFFREIGNYAYDHGTVIGMEANPPIYNTNYINDTISAIRLIKEVDSNGFRLNLDVGTMIHNKEDISVIADDTKLINHVHISEPNLKPIVDRNLHRELFVLLKEAGYSGFVSIEMGCQEDIVVVRNSMEYVRSIFV